MKLVQINTLELLYILTANKNNKEQVGQIIQTNEFSSI